jgi:hypothetical protein
MVTLIATTAGEYLTVDEGVYDAVIDSYTQEDDHPEYGPRVKIVVRITEEGDFLDSKVSGICSLKFSDKTKLRTWAEAAIGRKIEDGEEFNLDSILNCAVKLNVVHKKTSDGKVFDNIGALFPAKRLAKASSAAAAKRF